MHFCIFNVAPAILILSFKFDSIASIKVEFGVSASNTSKHRLYSRVNSF